MKGYLWCMGDYDCDDMLQLECPFTCVCRAKTFDSAVPLLAWANFGFARKLRAFQSPSGYVLRAWVRRLNKHE
jgi:hypothetical protein